jgi:hypothetical protein
VRDDGLPALCTARDSAQPLRLLHPGPGASGNTGPLGRTHGRLAARSQHDRRQP